MRPNYTKKELKELTDDEFLREIVEGRMATCAYIIDDRLFERLSKLHSKLSKRIELEQERIYQESQTKKTKRKMRA